MTDQPYGVAGQPSIRVKQVKRTTDDRTIPTEVIVCMLRRQAYRGRPVELSPLLAIRIAAELEAKKQTVLGR